MAMPALAQQTGRAPLDYRKLISASDLIYDKPVSRSEEGIPVGNGRMGTLVWTTPTQVRMQINRVDVYANNCATNSFFERHNDYCGGCGYVDIDFGTEVAFGPLPTASLGLRRRARDARAECRRPRLCAPFAGRDGDGGTAVGGR